MSSRLVSLALLSGGCNGVLGLDPTTLEAGQGGAPTSVGPGTTGTGGAVAATTTSSSSAPASTSSAGGEGGAGSSVTTSTGSAGGGAGGESPYTPSLCGGAAFDGGVVTDGGFESEGSWGALGGMTLDQPSDGRCEGTRYARLSSGLESPSLRGEVADGPLVASPCIEWSFSARSPDGAETTVEMFLNLDGDEFVPNNVTGVAGQDVWETDWSLFEGRCRLVLPTGFDDATISLTFPESRAVDVDALAVHTVACDEGFVDCHVP